MGERGERGERGEGHNHLQQLALQRVDLAAQPLQVVGLRPVDAEVAPQRVGAQLEDAQVLEPLAVLDLAARDRPLLHLELLGQQRELVVAPDQLRDGGEGAPREGQQGSGKGAREVGDGVAGDAWWSEVRWGEGARGEGRRRGRSSPGCRGCRAR